MIDLLDCPVMPYAWGSRHAIAELTGRSSPSSTPEAELWMGAHPSAPARLTRDGATMTLGDAITNDARRELGDEVASIYGARLPFLLKVLAAEEPLSLQAHPTAAQARAGYDDEDRRSIPRDAPHRNYRDASHKPELICALTPFDALCGFRRVDDTLRLFAELGVTELDEALAPLRAAKDGAGLRETFRHLMTLPPSSASHLAEATVAACARRSGTSEFERERSLAEKLAQLYPGDVGVVSALLLNLVHLEPGQAIYLDAGNLHAYLGGVGVEIMASSDNVLRGGLTKKHVDVSELMRVLDFRDGPVVPMSARTIDQHEREYDSPAREFRLSLLELRAGASLERSARGPEILLCTEGTASITPAGGAAPTTVRRGQSLFVAASTGAYRVEASTGASIYRAKVNLT